MRFAILFATAITGAAVVAAPTYAGVAVSGYNCTAVPDTSFEIIDHGNDHFSIVLDELYAPWGNTIYEIRPTTPGVVIDNLLVAIDGPVAGSPVIIRIYPACDGSGAIFQSIHNIVELGTAEMLLNYVVVEQDIGPIEIEAIGDMYCGRDCIGPIIATTPDNDIRGINKIHAGRHVLGDLLAFEGRVGYIIAQTGDMGSADRPLTIRARHDVLYLDAPAGNIYADVDARVGGTQGRMTFLHARKFHGRVETFGLKPGLTWPGQIVIGQQLAGDIIFHGGFSAPEFIHLPVGGLDGQIIFNADNLPASGGAAWTGPVHFKNGPVTQFVLTGPNYSQPASLLGGGSIGQAPFGLHGSSCQPAINSTLAVGPCSNDAIVRLRHYGPITLNGPVPVAIARRLVGVSSFTSIAASNFNLVIAPDDANTLAISPKIGAAVGFVPGYEYRITPLPALVCALVASALPVQSYDYRVTVVQGASCPSDLDCNGSTNGMDLAHLLASWGPCGKCGPDLNDNGVVNGLDLAILLGSWGPCGGAASGGVAGKPR